MPTEACFGNIGITTDKHFDKEWLQINKKNIVTSKQQNCKKKFTNFSTFSLHFYTLLVQT